MRLRPKIVTAALVTILASATAIAVALPFLDRPRVPVPDQNLSTCGAAPTNFKPRDPTSPPVEPLPLTTIVRTVQGPLRGPEGAFLIGDAATWAWVWCRTYSSAGSAPPLPWVDFGNTTVIAAFLADQRSCCYGVSIHRAFALEKGLVVQLQRYAEEPGLVYYQTLTHPFHFARVPGRWMNATFEWTRALGYVSFDVAPSAAAVATVLTFRLDNARPYPSLDLDLSNLTLASRAPWVVERFEGGAWVRVENHRDDATPRTIGSGQNASWTWTSLGSFEFPPVVPGIYRVRLTVGLSGTTFELTEDSRLY
jgi:hypothetical protein